MTARSGAPLVAVLLRELEDDASARAALTRSLASHLADDPGALIDAREMSNVTGLHPDTLVRMAREGRIYAVKVGREWRFRADRPETLPHGTAPRTLSPAPTPSRPTAPRRVRASVAAIRGPGEQA